MHREGLKGCYRLLYRGLCKWDDIAIFAIAPFFKFKIQFGNFNSAQVLGDASSEAQNPNRNQLNVESQSVSRQLGAESPRN